MRLAGLGVIGLGESAPSRGAAVRRSDGPPPIRSCIFIFRYGGPSHIDTVDLKPDAPAEVRGPFKPIATTVPGLNVCEHLPGLAKVMHKVAVVRSMHHTNRLHDSACIETLTGRFAPTGDRELFDPVPQYFPSFGGGLSWAWRDRGLDVVHAALPFTFRNVLPVPCQGAGFLGSAYDPLRIEVDPDRRLYRSELSLTAETARAVRRPERRSLLGALETIPGPSAQSLKNYYARAYRLLDSEPIRRALELEREDPRTRDRYGFDSLPSANGGNGAQLGFARHMRGQNLLLARRLVEAGVPYVSVYDFHQQGQNWDAHAQCFDQHKDFLLPISDRSLAALIDDLDARGLLDSTLIVATGEFGRTPRINQSVGRDHWPDCYSVILAGGGVRGGAVWGASDRLGAYPADRLVTPADLAATIYWRFGLDPATEIRDTLSRPYRLSDGEPMRDLFT